MRRRALVSAVASGLLLLGSGAAFAVSDGNYDNSKQGCSNSAENTSKSNQVQKDCQSSMLSLSDGQHTYFTVGTLQQSDHQWNDTSQAALRVCLDLGNGKSCAIFDHNGVYPEPQPAGQQQPAPAPQSGLHVYFGADDNLDFGEHDSSSQWDTGPSDGGGVQANVDPTTAAAWLAQVMAGNRSYVQTHPLPVGDAGTGACADGLCFDVQTQRRTVLQGSDPNKQRDLANYSGKQWDPSTCAGPSDTPSDCGGHDLKYWNDQEGTVYAEPGIQVYEDPDAQGSPEGPSYPIPALYVGTCGLIVGGGNVNGQDVAAPASPLTNDAGQIVIPLGC